MKCEKHPEVEMIITIKGTCFGGGVEFKCYECEKEARATGHDKIVFSADKAGWQ